MSYDVYITRALDWTLSAKRPISWDEWMEVVRDDPGLELSSTDYSYSGEQRVFDTVRWLGHPDTWPFWLSDGAVETKNPDALVLGKMEDIAAKLGARVQGEDEIFDDYLATLPKEDEPEGSSVC